MTGERPEALDGAEVGIEDSVTTVPVISAEETGLRVAGGSYWVHVARTDRPTNYAHSP